MDAYVRKYACVCSVRVCVLNINAFNEHRCRTAVFRLPFLAQAQVAAGGHNGAQADQCEQHQCHIFQAAHKARDGGVAGAWCLPKLGQFNDAWHCLGAVKLLQLLLLQLQRIQLQTSQGSAAEVEGGEREGRVRVSAYVGQAEQESAAYSCSCSISSIAFVCGSTA